jgi:hypothetical protein
MHTKKKVASCQLPVAGSLLTSPKRQRGVSWLVPGGPCRVRPRNNLVAIVLLAVLVVGSVGAGWLVAGHVAAGQVNAPSSAPGTLPAADHQPPPWQVAPPAIPADATPIYRGLHEIARTVTCIVDGEVVKEIVTERAQEKVFAVDPKDKWAAGDNWDYNHEPFIKTKQILERACCLAPGQVGCNLYMPAMFKPAKWLHVINNVNGVKQMLNTPGDMVYTPDPELLQVFMTGQRLEVSRNEGAYSVLTPVYDSLGQITAVVEVATRDAGFKQVRK